MMIMYICIAFSLIGLLRWWTEYRRYRERHLERMALKEEIESEYSERG